MAEGSSFLGPHSCMTLGRLHTSLSLIPDPNQGSDDHGSQEDGFFGGCKRTAVEKGRGVGAPGVPWMCTL